MPKGFNVAITGLGTVTAVGVGIDRLWTALQSGSCFITTIDQTWAIPPYVWGAPVGEFNARELIPLKRLRRLSRFSQMAVVSASQALTQADLSDASSVGVVLGTGLGPLSEMLSFMHDMREYGAIAANPAIFPTTVMNVAAAQVAMELNLRGYNTTINHKEVSAEMAFQVAVDALRLGHVPSVLVGGIEELNYPTYHGYYRMGALGKTRSIPYHPERDGLALGEGACIFHLEQVAHAKQRKAKVLAEIAGIGAAGEARSMIAWSKGIQNDLADNSSLNAGVRAIEIALNEAELSPDQVDLVVGCGCGSPTLDQLESQILNRVFGKRAVPVINPHGNFGTWMASGSLRMATAVGTLLHQELFPTIAPPTLDPSTPMPGLVYQRRNSKINSVLICSHATGGASAAIILIRGDN